MNLLDRMSYDTLIEQLRTELTTLLNETITDYTNRLDNFGGSVEKIRNDLLVYTKIGDEVKKV